MATAPIRILTKTEVDSPSYVRNAATDVVNYGATEYPSFTSFYIYRGVPFAVKSVVGGVVSYLEDTDDIAAFANDQAEQTHATCGEAIDYWVRRIGVILDAQIIASLSHLSTEAIHEMVK